MKRTGAGYAGLARWRSARFFPADDFERYWSNIPSHSGRESMVRFRRRFGFPANRDYCFRLRGRRYRVGSSGIRTLKLLTKIHDSCATCRDLSWLFRLRNHIREVQALHSRSVLSLVVERTEDPTLRLLAIWLRGRCGGSLGTSSLAKFATHPDEQTRKEVARALKRMGDWVQLRELADDEPNARVRRMATPRPTRSYLQRYPISRNIFPA